MPQAFKKRIFLSRMVRDSFNRTAVHSQEQDQAAETKNQSELPAEATGCEQPQSTRRVESESQQPSEGQVDFLLWGKLVLKEETDPCCQVSAQGFLPMSELWILLL